MSYSLSEQLTTLLAAFVLGLFAGVVYCVFGAVRMILRKKYMVFILDVTFMVLLTFSTVLFSIGYSRGYTRYFTVMGELAGFVLVRISVGRIIKFLVYKTFYASLCVYKKCKEYSIKSAKKLLQLLRFLLYNIIRRKIPSADSSADNSNFKRGENHREAESNQE